MNSEAEGVEWRKRIVEMCKVSLLDAAFHSLGFNRSRLRSGFTPPPPPIDLSELFPDADEAQLARALRAAERLEASETHFAALLYRGEGQHAFDSIRVMHPGFSDICYASVLQSAQAGAR